MSTPSTPGPSTPGPSTPSSSTGGTSPGPELGPPPSGEVEDLPPNPRPKARDRARVTTVRGTVQAGVEAGCLVMSTPDGMVNLLGAGTGKLRPGMRVEITGSPDDTRLTTCQQGRPFLVTEVRILS